MSRVAEEYPEEEGNGLITFCGDEDEDDVPDMPFFEASNLDDRPVAPPPEEYPLGCEVELRDIEFAKSAQEESHWEPFMDMVFAVPRRRVRVHRHCGDYTFILCTDVEGYERVGCTLYRACLSEPKVKTTRYYAAIGSNHSAVEYEQDNDDLFMRPVRAPESVPLPHTASSESAKGSIVTVSSNGTSVNNAAGIAAPKPAVGAEERKTNFIALMKRGTAELSRKHFRDSLEWYNRALEESPEEEGRVRSSRSVAFLMLGEKERALEDANAVIALLPHSSIGYVRAGNVFRTMHKYGDAQKMYSTANKHEPGSDVIRNLLEGNSVAMLYDTRLRRFRTVRMVYDEHQRCAVMQAARNISEGDCIFKEFSNLAYPFSSRVGSAVTNNMPTPLCCNCCRPRLSGSSVMEQLPFFTSEHVRRLHKERSWVKCSGGCTAVYCSDECREKAWMSYHWLECTEKGRWREGIKSFHTRLDTHMQESLHTPVLLQSEALVYTKRNLQEDMSAAVVATCARICSRMISLIAASELPPEEAPRKYRWLPVHDCVKKQRGEVKELLTECFALLSQQFDWDQHQRITFEVFRDCYERVKSNAVPVVCTVWPRIVEHMEAQRNLLSRDDLPAGFATKSLFGEEEYKAITQLPPYGPSGTYFVCLTVLEFFCLTRPQNCGSEATAKCNAQIATNLESAAVVRLLATTSIKKGDPVVTNYPRMNAPKAH